MALIYLGYRALKKKMGDGNEEEELTEEEKNAKLAEPVKKSKVKSVGGAAGGAAIGSMILPGVGTVIGAGVGAVMGTKVAEKDKVKKEQNNKQELDRINSMKRLEAQSEALYDTMNVIVIRYEGAKLGLHLKQNDHGVYISQVDEKSPAADAQLGSGDLITSVDGVNVSGKSVSQVVEVLKQTKSEIHFTVKRLKQQPGSTSEESVEPEKRSEEVQPESKADELIDLNTE